MKLLLPSKQLQLLLFYPLSFLLILSLGSCARKVHFNTSTIVPAAQGNVKIKKDNNNNYSVDLNVTNLAEPKRLQPPMQVYVVWAETEKSGVQNLGQLNTSSGLLSSKLKASLETNTPFKPIRIFITAEDQANIQYPNSYVVLNTNNF